MLKTQRKKFEKSYVIVNASVAENEEKKIWIKLYDNKYFYGTFNSNFSLQNKQLQQLIVQKKLGKISFFCKIFKKFKNPKNFSKSILNHLQIIPKLSSTHLKVSL